MGFLRQALPTGATALRRYLKGVRFPIRKQEESVAQLKRNRVSRPVLI